ncbi:Hint domain-containing protein [Falsirhodobacter algicola]|uniref:Hedgehog/Intein (Hint) domain-containing protein n=1 Tax=Falsirhodobacter algicola TaxID=2692330 RepID=A0A8J8SKP2_9RHOB|nr:Hint domain-containing protein [Falsirhodobacter algicola]QUS35563.1 hypothetical protein GR316_04325 [Falsirhodobacter algicola]
MATLFGTTGNDTRNGTSGDDLIYGGPDDSEPEVDTGSDVVNAYGGNDTVYTGDQNDSIFGGDGDDLLYGGADDDSLVGGAGADTLYGGDGTDRLLGAAGADLIYGGAGNDYLDGGTENDTLIGGAGADTIYGGTGLDFVDYSASAQAIAVSLSTNRGTAGDAAGDVLGAVEGVIGSNYADTITGGTGNETLFGGAGNDILTGNAGDDVLDGGTGDDSLDGGTGADSFIGGAGADTIIGGAGTDTLTYDGSDAVSLDLTSGTGTGGFAAGDVVSGIEVVVGSAFGDALLGTASAESLYGAAGNDTLTGRGGADVLFGGTGNDVLYGGTGTDSLLGEDGNDSILGGAGADTLSGGAGLDTLRGGEGNDLLDGGADADTLEGGGGSDSILGGDGNDVIRGDGVLATADPTALVWSAQGASGTDVQAGFTQSTGAIDVGFSYSTQSSTTRVTLTNDAQYTGGTASTSGLLFTSNGTGPETATLTFTSTTEGISDEVGNVSFRVNDLDAATGADSYVDQVQITAYDSDGNTVAVTLTPAGDDTVSGQTATAASGSNNPDQAQGSVLVEIAGPVARIEISYSSASGTGQRYLYLTDVAFSPRSIVEGNDTLDGGEGDDLLEGDGGNDILYGGAGNDTLDGGTGGDTLYGGAGDDVLILSGSDSAEGGLGNDTFRFSGTPTGSATISGGDGRDVLNLSGTGNYSFDSLNEVTEGGSTSFAGVVRFENGSTVTFSEVENIICFTPGTMILTPHGERPVEDLRPGDSVVTRDDGVQVLRWTGMRKVMAAGRFAPVWFAAGSLPGLRAPIRVSPQHRMLVGGPRAELHLGSREVLVPARHLVGCEGIDWDASGMVTYIHLMFDRHQLIFANGVTTESFHPGSIGLSALDDAAREELFTLFPELRSSMASYGSTVRPVARAHESRLLV